MPRATLDVNEVASLSGVSPWTIREAIKDGDCPFPFLRVGRRIVFPTAKVAEALGEDSENLLDRLAASLEMQAVPADEITQDANCPGGKLPSARNHD
jgi:predicted DNA-binding transcriptional regulator AlpA